MRKQLLKALIIVLILLVLGVVWAANYLLDYSLKPEALAGTHQNERLYEEMRKDYPQTVSWLDSMQQHHLLRDTFVTSPVDGSKLHAVYAHAAKSTPKTAVLVHGYTDCFIKMLPIGYMYNKELGFNILLMDHHAHGHSEGEAVQMGWLDRLDVLNWMQVARAIFSTSKADAELVVHGVSMGAATTMFVSGDVDPLAMPYVKCFVEDCGYTSVWDEFAGELENRFHLPEFPLLYVASALCDFRYGWNFSEASAVKQVARCQLPMLFIHGDKDTFVPTAMVYKVYEAKPEPKTLWVTPGVSHAQSYYCYPNEYRQKVKAFTEKYF